MISFIVVVIPPQFVLTPETQEATEGNDVGWSCKVRGKPPPALTWFRNNELLDGQPSVRIKAKESSRKLEAESSLTLNKCDISMDSNTYRIEAQNSAGNASHEFGLIGTVTKVPVCILRKHQHFLFQISSAPTTKIHLDP